ncbi:hypothetical protein [Fimbriiglobus ruber]|uniref:Uncharacterized protein n=1 Tax=Fimbriiglobus ruber TaxID=1908690 RepID=A0A225E133_9BACT|nr:hypothetical protein [Fimbriiglobus ruber]OWK42077.1 hypothetical protein FRUB_04155 [Fimbriiglobus ruber]
MDRETAERLTRVEILLEDTKAEVKVLEEKLEYYDRLALKWGGACMGAVALGALISGHFDKICEKLWAFFQ